jgi:putative phosphoribosyl transferase
MKRDMAQEIHREAVNLQGPLLPADLMVPEHATGLVMFAHGSGSSRHSSRNRWLAEVLQQHGLATLMFDLLTEEEAKNRCKVFNIALLARRVGEAMDWVEQRAQVQRLPVGIFGESTGAAAALLAAAQKTNHVAAVVSRGGRPDLAMTALPQVRAPTLLIVGGLDTDVLSLNREALRQLGGTKRLEVVPDATHLFDEPGTLESVAAVAARWFERHLVDTDA